MPANPRTSQSMMLGFLYLKTAKNSVSRETFSNDLPIVMQ